MFWAWRPRVALRRDEGPKRRKGPGKGLSTVVFVRFSMLSADYADFRRWGETPEWNIVKRKRIEPQGAQRSQVLAHGHQKPTENLWMGGGGWGVGDGREGENAMLKGVCDRHCRSKAAGPSGRAFCRTPYSCTTEDSQMRNGQASPLGISIGTGCAG